MASHYAGCLSQTHTLLLEQLVSDHLHMHKTVREEPLLFSAAEEAAILPEDEPGGD